MIPVDITGFVLVAITAWYLDGELLDGFVETYWFHSLNRENNMDMYTHELAALIYANNVDKGVVWAFERAKEFMEESDRRVLEEEMDDWENYDYCDWDFDDEYDSQNALNYRNRADYRDPLSKLYPEETDENESTGDNV